MKGLFLIFHEFSEEEDKDILTQLSAFRAIGIDIKLCQLVKNDNNECIRIIDDKVIANYGKGIKGDINKHIKYHSLFNYIFKSGIKFVYIKHDYNSNPFLVHFVRKLNDINVKTILELPKARSTKAGLKNYFNRMYSDHLTDEVSRIISYDEIEDFEGIETTQILRKEDFENIKLKENVTYDPYHINILGVNENIEDYERIIKGMQEYCRKPHKVGISLHIVGGKNTEHRILDNYLKDNQLKYGVFLYGQKTPEELDKLFEIAHIGLVCIGNDRKNIKQTYEFAKRGLPFISTMIDGCFENLCCVMKISQDDSPINIQSIINFFYNQKMTPEEISELANQNLSLEVQMQKVIKETVLVN